MFGTRRCRRTRVSFRQTAQCPGDSDGLSHGRRKTLVSINGGKQGALSDYRALVNAFSGKRIQPLVQELDRTLTQLELLSNNGAQVKQPLALNELVT